MEARWQEWRRFPDPRKGEYLVTPFGAGVYMLRHAETKEVLYVGEGSNVAYRVTSLLPEPFGRGRRNNAALRQYLLENLALIEYRTAPCATKAAAKVLEKQLQQENPSRF